MNLINKLEKMGDERVRNLEAIARSIGRGWIDDPLIQENVESAKHENNVADAEYYANQ